MIDSSDAHGLLQDGRGRQMSVDIGRLRQSSETSGQRQML